MARARQIDSAEPDLVVAAALRIEARALRRGARSAQIVYTGMGGARARRAAAELRDRPGRALAVAGVSGALDSNLKPGDLIVVSALCEPKGDEPQWRELESAQKLLEILDRSGQRAILGRLATLDHIVRRREHSELLEAGAQIVDMETAHLALGAAGRPLAVVRVVVDTPEQGFASLSFFRNGVRALRELGVVVSALERWAAECAPKPHSNAHPHTATAPSEAPRPEAAPQQPIRRSTWRCRYP